MNIAFVGSFEQHKGSDTFIDVVNSLGSRFSWSIFGVIKDPGAMLKDLHVPLVSAHSYYWWDLPRVLRKHHIDLVLLLSPIPESYSLTFFECMSAEVPVISSDNGYPKMAFPNYPFFIDMRKGSAEVVKRIVEIDEQRYLPKLTELIQWYKREHFADMEKKVKEKYVLIDRLLSER